MSEHQHNTNLPRLAHWVTEPDRHWFGRCDDCGKRRISLWLYDCYPGMDSLPDLGFWWVCADCLIADVSDIASALMQAGTNTACSSSTNLQLSTRSSAI